MERNSLRIGYVPYSPMLNAPGDRRRFVYYARKRNLQFEIAQPEKDYDVVVLSERADISVWGRYKKGKIVYDLIDSYLAIPKDDIRGRLRGLAKFISRQSRYPELDHWRAIEKMCRICSAVVCSTEEQKRDIALFCTNVHIILDVHSSITRTVKRDYVAGRPFRLVWEGVPQTMGSLELIRPVLERLRRRHPIELHLITDLEYYRYLGRYGKSDTLAVARRIFSDIKVHVWKEESLADVVCSCDLAIIPLALTDPFASGKPENKLLLFWRMGMPVLASATPAYLRAMTKAGLPMACKDALEWELALEKYLTDEKCRREAGVRGLLYSQTYHDEEKSIKQWDMLFESLF